MAKWEINRNLVPGHYKGLKRIGKMMPYTQRFSRSVKIPGYDIRSKSYGTQWEKRRSHALWFKPFKSKPLKRREKRGQSKPGRR